jgi:Ala-tRNA(Pro) deacylase
VEAKAAAMDIYAFLQSHQIDYRRYDHPPVFTCAEAEALVPEMDAARTKNIFLRDRKGVRHYLVVVGYHKMVDLKALAPRLGADRLSLGSEERLARFLGVTPGSVTILALAHDSQGGVQVVFDQDIAAAEALRCHPMVNTATLAISQADVRRFLEATAHPLTVLEVPGRPND